MGVVGLANLKDGEVGVCGQGLLFVLKQLPMVVFNSHCALHKEDAGLLL